MLIRVTDGDANRVKTWNDKSKLTPNEFKFLKALFRYKSPVKLDTLLKHLNITKQVFFLNLRNMSKKCVLDWKRNESKQMYVEISIQDPSQEQVDVESKAPVTYIKKNNININLKNKRINIQNYNRLKQGKSSKKEAHTGQEKSTTIKQHKQHQLSGYNPKDRWKILKNPNHKLYPLVSKAVANEIIKIYDSVREENGYKPYYQAIKYKDKFVAIAVFCNEHEADVLEYIRFAVKEYDWLKSFPTPANVSGPYIMNKWLSKDVQRKVGGKQYRQPVKTLPSILSAAGFNGEYTQGDYRYIQSVAIDHAKFGNVDLHVVQFSDEIECAAKNIKSGKLKV